MFRPSFNRISGVQLKDAVGIFRSNQCVSQLNLLVAAAGEIANDEFATGIAVTVADLNAKKLSAIPTGETSVEIASGENADGTVYLLPSFTLAVVAAVVAVKVSS